MYDWDQLKKINKDQFFSKNIEYNQDEHCGIGCKMEKDKLFNWSIIVGYKRYVWSFVEFGALIYFSHWFWIPKIYMRRTNSSHVGRIEIDCLSRSLIMASCQLKHYNGFETLLLTLITMQRAHLSIFSRCGSPICEIVNEDWIYLLIFSVSKSWLSAKMVQGGIYS